jgi:hypothetical protein
MEQDLRITSNRLSITEKELDKLQADVDTCHERIQGLAESNTDLRFRLAKKEEQFYQLDDRLTMVERLVVRLEDQRRFEDQRRIDEQRRKRTAHEGNVVEERPAKRTPEEEMPPISGPSTSGPDVENIPTSTESLVDQVEDPTFNAERDEVNVEEPPAFIGPIMPSMELEGKVSDGADETISPGGCEGERSNSAPDEDSSLSAMRPPHLPTSTSIVSTMPPIPPSTLPPPPNVTIQPPTPHTSQEAAETGVLTLLKVPEENAEEPRPRSRSRSRSPAPPIGDRRRSPRLQSPGGPSQAGTSKRVGDPLDDQPPSKKKREHF